MENTVDTEKLALAEERIKNGLKRVAKCLNMLETASQEIKWACESQRWNDDVAFQIDEAATKLGFALATLTNWDDDVDSEFSDNA